MLNYIFKYYRLIIIIFGIPILLILDSPIGDYFLNNYGQETTTVLAFIAFISAYITGHQRVKDTLLIGMVVGLAGEYILSSLFGMYHYRFDNIPLWLAFGHGLLFALVFRLSRKYWIRKNRKVIQNILIGFSIIYSILWLLFMNDWFGFLCTVIFLSILFFAKKSRLFFLIMFTIVCYLEQIGVVVGCWYWPQTTFGIENGIPSGNPPSGISVFYFIFDAIALWVYLNILHPKLRKRYYIYNQ